MSLEQLRSRMPLLRQREHPLRYELNALVEQTRERAAHLRLAVTLSALCHEPAHELVETVDIVRARSESCSLVVKEVTRQ